MPHAGFGGPVSQIFGHIVTDKEVFLFNLLNTFIDTAHDCWLYDKCRLSEGCGQEHGFLFCYNAGLFLNDIRNCNFDVLYFTSSLLSSHSSDDPRRSSMYVESTSNINFADHKLRSSASMDKLNMITGGSSGDKVLCYSCFAL